MHRVVEDLLDTVLDQVKEGLDDYASYLRCDLELYVSHAVRRAARATIVWWEQS